LSVVPLLEDDEETHTGKWKVKSEKCRKKAPGGKMQQRTHLSSTNPKDPPIVPPYDPTAVYTPIGSPYINATPASAGFPSLSLDQTRRGDSFESTRTSATAASKVSKS
jgi:hypothetical protein